MKRSRSTLAMFLATYCGALWWMGFQSGQPAAALAVDPPSACVLSADRSIEDVRTTREVVSASTAHASPHPLVTLTRGAVLAAKSVKFSVELKDRINSILESTQCQLASIRGNIEHNPPETAGMMLDLQPAETLKDSKPASHFTLVIAAGRLVAAAVQQAPAPGDLVREYQSQVASLDKFAGQFARDSAVGLATRLQSNAVKFAADTGYARFAAGVASPLYRGRYRSLIELGSAAIEVVSRYGDESSSVPHTANRPAPHQPVSAPVSYE